MTTKATTMEPSSWNIILDRLGDFKFQNGLYSFVNPYSMLRLKNQTHIAQGIDFWFVDGISLVNKINKLNGGQLTRVSFDETSLAPIVFQYVKQNQLKLAIIGTTTSLVQQAIANIEETYKVKINYFRDGYFRSAEDRAQCLEEILSRGIEVVICGMGTPMQEAFLIDLKNRGWSGYGFTCGGFLHQVAKKKNYYPSFFDRYNIRWVYRIIDEPKLLKRYALLYPKFFLQFRRFAAAVEKRS